MRPSEFLALVEKGLLPPPCDIGGCKRWIVADLERIAFGSTIEGPIVVKKYLWQDRHKRWRVRKGKGPR